MSPWKVRRTFVHTVEEWLDHHPDVLPAVNYYNEFDPKTAAWLRELIKKGLIADGIVDERSITEVHPDDLSGFTQVHMFAGIGGWSYALRLAGWPDDFPVWTGSCPCQPFSSAGKSEGANDSRHLWPVFFSLIKKQRPEHVFGEQVARAIGFNWLDGVCADLEGEDYTLGATVLGAHSVRSPHTRQRLYWVAVSESKRGCWRNTLERRNRAKPRGSNEDICFTAWPGGRGSKSTISCSEILEKIDGVSCGMVRLRGYGNAIVPQVAQVFIEAYLDCLKCHQKLS